MIDKFLLEEIIVRGLKEDIDYMDLTSELTIDDRSVSKAVVIAKENGMIAGLQVFGEVFKYMDEDVQIDYLVKDGNFVKKGTKIIGLQGSTKAMLKSERLALNLLQRMSGIATKASHFARAVKGYDVKVVDTRKTTPGLRCLEKYAVRVGGCYNHRYNLSQAVMIKDNHIVACGGIGKAVEKVRANIGHTVKIEVEVENIPGLQEAIESKADIVMLDNMAIDRMIEAVKMNNGRVILEASGNISMENIEEVAKTGIDIISIGALTHSYKSMDISMRII